MVEVASPSSGSRDHNQKLIGYFMVPSVQHYLIIHSDRRILVHHARRGDEIATRILHGGRLRLEPPGLDLKIEDSVRGRTGRRGVTVEVAVFNAAGLLPAALEAEIRAGIDDGISALRRHLDVEDAGIVVLLAEGVDAETGMGGRAYGPDAGEIRVDEASPALRAGTRVNAASVTVHELHHVLRMRHGVPRRFAELCAGDIIVLEGLATGARPSSAFPTRPSSGASRPSRSPPLDRIAPIIGYRGADWT